MKKQKPNSANKKNLTVGGNVSTKPLTRNMQTMTIYAHELQDIRKDIKRGIPINWGLRLLWSIFCLCAGDIITNALTKDNFTLKSYLMNLNGFTQAILVVSFLGSILLLFLSKAQGSAIEGIDQILKQHGL